MKRNKSVRNHSSALGIGIAFWTISFCVPAVGQQAIPPEKVVGRDACKNCHASEFAAWEHSSHNLKAWKLLDHPKAPEFAKALGVTDIKGASVCTECHGTQQKIADKLTVAEGNSCESCHGAAGGEKGWFRLHFDYGQGNVTPTSKMADVLAGREKETKEHRAARDAACKKAGMNRSADALAIARNCLQCHLVPNEKLVEAGHPISTRFEFVEWAQGEVRHNFLLDPKKNAEAPTNWTDAFRNGEGRTVDGRKRLMVVAGQLADLEVSLRSRAISTSTKRGSLGDEANDRILDMQEELDELGIDGLAPVLAVIKDVDKKSLREVTSDDKKKYTGLADAFAKAAETFLAANASGADLPDGIKLPTRAKGEPHQP